MARAHFDARLQCRVRSLKYDFDRRIGRLNLPPDHDASVVGAIALFTSIDPEVVSVIVVSDGETLHHWTSDEFPRLLSMGGAR